MYTSMVMSLMSHISKNIYMMTAETHTYIVPDGCYFMLGDNRNNSKDSRYWTNTYVKKEKIIAKVLIRYYSGEKGRISFSRIS